VPKPVHGLCGRLVARLGRFYRSVPAWVWLGVGMAWVITSRDRLGLSGVPYPYPRWWDLVSLWFVFVGFWMIHRAGRLHERQRRARDDDNT